MNIHDVKWFNNTSHLRDTTTMLGIRQQKPTILVVEDKVMKLEEENNLSQPARQVILNNSNSGRVVTGKFSGLNSCEVNTVLLSVQLFDEKFYPSEITLFDFLMDSNHEVISFSMLAEIQRFWNF